MKSFRSEEGIMINELEIAERFDYLLRQRDLKDKEAGIVLGVSQGTIYNWRTGSHPIGSLSSVDRICDEFGCSIEWLIYGTDDVQKEANRRARKNVKLFLERVAEETLKLSGRLKP